MTLGRKNVITTFNGDNFDNVYVVESAMKNGIEIVSNV